MNIRLMPNQRQNHFAVKPWTLVLGFGLLLMVLSGIFLENTGRALSENLLRLHVVAHSDTVSDQALKLSVRDEVLHFLTPMLSDATTPAEARDILIPLLDDIENKAGQALLAQGCELPVRASLNRMNFPTKTYDGFKLPAGSYNALRLEIGEGKGQNWWCVVFPPLCVAAAEDVTIAASEGGLNAEQIRLITEDGQTYVLTFKCLEWWDGVKAFFKY